MLYFGRCPRMNRFIDGVPGFIQGRKPMIRRRFVTNAPPYPLLDIQPRLIARQKRQRQSSVMLKKNIDVFAFMPAGAVHQEPDLVVSQASVKPLQAQKKAFSIPLGMTNQPRFSQKRGHPTKNIQPCLMPACRRNSKSPAAFGPAHAQTRMESKACLIFIHHRLLRPQIFEFFLRSWQISWHPPSAPGDKHSCCVSADTPIGASTSEPGGPSVLSRTDALCEPPVLAHPSGRGLTRIPGESSPDHPRGPSESCPSVESADPASVTPLAPSLPARSSYASNYSGSDGSIPKCRLSISAFVLLK